MHRSPAILTALALSTTPLATSKAVLPEILFTFSNDHALQAITVSGDSRYKD